jgi:hypothetical protein
LKHPIGQRFEVEAAAKAGRASSVAAAALAETRK